MKPASQSHSALLPRSFRKHYPTAVRGEGVFLWDDKGNKYLDYAASAVVNFIGHGVRQVSEAIAAQSQALEFIHSSQFVSEAAERFAEELLDFLGLAYRDAAVFFTSGGSEAVESALKLTRQYQVETNNPARHQIVSRRQSYHGATLGAMAVSGNLKRKAIYGPMLKEFSQVGTPYCYRCPYGCNDCARQYAQELDDVLAQRGAEVAAFIYEPISGATLGAAVPPEGYLRQIHDICARRGVLTIADEVMTGMGRTGRALATQHFGVTPDIVILAKGLSSGYAPLGAVVASRRIVDAIASGSGALVHGFTYNAHPPSVAAGRAVLQVIHAQRLLEAADDHGKGAGAHLKRALSRLRELDWVGDMRGLGLMWAAEFVRDRATKEPFPPALDFAGRVAQACMQRGVVVYPMQGCVDGYRGDHLMIAPPAVITPAEIDFATEQLSQAIQATGNSVRQ